MAISKGEEEEEEMLVSNICWLTTGAVTVWGKNISVVGRRLSGETDHAGGGLETEQRAENQQARLSVVPSVAPSAVPPPDDAQRSVARVSPDEPSSQAPGTCGEGNVSQMLSLSWPARSGHNKAK